MKTAAFDPAMPMNVSVLRASMLVLVLLGTMPPCLRAQTEGGLPKLSTLPASTRGMALGDAYMMNAGHSHGMFVHPALLESSSGFSLDLQRWGEHASAASVSAATEWFGGDIGVGVGIRALQYTGPAAGADAAPPGQDHLFDLGTTPVSERLASLGAAGTFFGIGVGATVKLLEERVGGVGATIMNVDVGVAREIGPVTVGVTAQDWGYAPIGDRGDIGPARTVIGVGSYGRELGFLDVGAAAHATVTSDEVGFGGGVELGYWPVRGRTFVARVGARQVPDGSDASPLTMGFAFWGDALLLEWAFQPVSDAPEGGTHRVSIGWR